MSRVGRAEHPNSCGIGPHGLDFAFLDRAESGRYFWLETWTTEMRIVLLANVQGQEVVAVSQDQNLSTLAMVLTMNARRFQRTHPLTVGVVDFAHVCGLESMVDAVRATVVGSACAGLEFDAGSGHKVRSSDVCSIGDTR